MSKKEVLAATKKFHQLSIDQIKDLKKLPPAQIQDEIRYLKPKLEDRLFLTIGVDNADLDFNTDKLDMENDEEYQKLFKEYYEAVELEQKS